MRITVHTLSLLFFLCNSLRAFNLTCELTIISDQMVELQSLWAKQTAVVVFLRRFGWQLCRLWSTELSSVKSQLDAHNVRLCGVGLEELGLEEFIEKKFFTGGLEKKNCWTFWMIHAFLLIRIWFIAWQMHKWCHHWQHFAFLSCETNRLLIAVGLFSNRSEKTLVRTSMTLSCSLHAFFFCCSLHVS